MRDGVGRLTVQWPRGQMPSRPYLSEEEISNLKDVQCAEEPFLIRADCVMVTRDGRRLTTKGTEYLGGTRIAESGCGDETTMDL